jgi:hypothetical protein
MPRLRLNRIFQEGGRLYKVADRGKLRAMFKEVSFRVP